MHALKQPKQRSDGPAPSKTVLGASLLLALLVSAASAPVQSEVLNKSWNFTSVKSGVTHSGTFSLTGLDTNKTYLDSNVADLRVCTTFDREGAGGDAFTFYAGDVNIQVGGAVAGTRGIQAFPAVNDWLIMADLNQTQGWFWYYPWYFPTGTPPIGATANPSTVSAGLDGRPGVTDLTSVTRVSNEAAGGHTLPIRAGETSRAVSPDGRFVVFTSAATTLAATGGVPLSRVYLRDRQTGVTEVVSVGLNGASPNGPSYAGSISLDGRYVAFYSEANNLVMADTNGWSDVFVRDRQAGVTARISLNAAGGQADGASFSPSIDAVGRHVAFVSAATNLVSGDTNGKDDVFVRDRETGTVWRASLAVDEGQQADADSSSPSIRADGEEVAYVSLAKLYPDDDNGKADIYVSNFRHPGLTYRVSYGLDLGQPNGYGTNWALPNGASYQPGISTDGRFVVFESSASNLVPGDTNGKSDIFVRDRRLNLTERISVSTSQVQANGESISPSLSYDGQFVAFESSATNLVPGDTNAATDVFLRDRRTGRTDRASVNSEGVQANARSGRPAVNCDGRFVAFASLASNLATNDYNADWDLYAHGFGGEVPAPVLRYTVNPQALDFGTLELFATRKTLDFWIWNKSGVPMGTFDIGVVGNNPQMFQIVENYCGTLPVSTACRVSVRFTPTSVGDKSATLRVVVDNLVRTRSMTGTGVRSAFTLSPRSLNFGGVPINTTSPAQTVKITNTGQGVLPISSISLWGTDKDQFTKSHNCPNYVLVGGSCTASVRFKPPSAGARSAHIAVWARGGAGGESVPVYGTGY